MDELKKQYKKINPPKGSLEIIENKIICAKKTRKKMTYIRVLSIVMVIFSVFIAFPNISYNMAEAMQNIPIVGKIFEITTFREYNISSENRTAQVKVPRIIADENYLNNKNSAEVDRILSNIEMVNFNINDEVEKLINEFNDSYNEELIVPKSLYINSEVITDTERYFSLKLMLYTVEASGYEMNRFYTIDKTNGEVVKLQDIYGENYIEDISEKIIQQMIIQTSSDKSKVYWIGDNAIQNYEFKKIPPDQDFYINSEGKVVIAFDEYEVAPGYMGSVEFTLD